MAKETLPWPKTLGRHLSHEAAAIAGTGGVRVIDRFMQIHSYVSRNGHHVSVSGGRLAFGLASMKRACVGTVRTDPRRRRMVDVMTGTGPTVQPGRSIHRTAS